MCMFNYLHLFDDQKIGKIKVISCVILFFFVILFLDWVYIVFLIENYFIHYCCHWHLKFLNQQYFLMK